MSVARVRGERSETCFQVCWHRVKLIGHLANLFRRRPTPRPLALPSPSPGPTLKGSPSQTHSPSRTRTGWRRSRTRGDGGRGHESGLGTLLPAERQASQQCDTLRLNPETGRTDVGSVRRGFARLFIAFFLGGGGGRLGGVVWLGRGRHGAGEVRWWWSSEEVGRRGYILGASKRRLIMEADTTLGGSAARPRMVGRAKLGTSACDECL